MNTRNLQTCIVITIFAAHAALAQNSAAQQHWVATWAASPIAAAIPAAPAAPPVAAGAPAAAPAKPAGPPPFRSANNQTIRMVANTSIGGSSVRVELANTFGMD